MRRRIRELTRRIVERAREAGVLRRDFAPEDMLLVFWASHRVMDLAAPAAPDAWRRQLAFVLDGLRPAAATPLPQPPLTQAQLKRAGRIQQAGSR